MNCKRFTRYCRFIKCFRYALTCYNLLQHNDEEIKSSIDWFSPIKRLKPHKPTLASDPTHCARAHDMSNQPIQVEVTLYLSQIYPGS